MGLHNKPSKLRITSTTRSVNQLRPSTKWELRTLIQQELLRQGPDADLNFIDTSEVTDMSFLFYGLAIGNIKIDMWNVSNVRTMEGMFYELSRFNCDLSDWDVSNVENMNGMFRFCGDFNCDLSRWNVSNVKAANVMFEKCYKLNCDLSNWNMPNINSDNLIGMLLECHSFNKELTPKCCGKQNPFVLGFDNNE